MTLATTLLAAALVVPSMPPPEYDDCEVVTNCVFGASRSDAKEFSVQIEFDATPSNGVEVVFGRDADGDGILSRLEETMTIGYDCGEWRVMNLVTGDKFSYAGTSGRVALDWKLRLNGEFLFDSTWNAAKIIQRGQSDPNLQVVCSVDNIPLVIRLR